MDAVVEILRAPPLMGTGNEDGRTLLNPALDLAMLLPVDHQQMVGIQSDAITHVNRFNLKSVDKHFTWPGGDSI